MNKYSVCILDEKIPASSFPDVMDDKKLLNRNNFGHLISHEGEWGGEPALFKLATELYKKQDEYELSGFTHHSFFFNHIEENLFSPDIVIFDWDVGDMGGVETNSEENLLKLLQSRYCLVAIFTGADRESEVTNVISSKDFKDFYGNRLFLIRKESDNSANELQVQIDRLKSENFSFGLGRDLKMSALASVENILINIGKLSFNQFVTAFGHYDRSVNKSILSKIDFTDLFVEKLQTELLNSDFGDFPLKAEKEKVNDNLLLKKIWHFRLYHFPKDEIIRKGDIIKKNDDNRLFLVLTSDCHLAQFWKKNLGHLTLVPLYEFEDVRIRKKIRENINVDTIPQFKITSLVNPQKIENITVFPAVVWREIKKQDPEDSGKETYEEDYCDYILSAKEVFSVRVPKPKLVESGTPLLSSHLSKYDGNGRLRITEPFLSPLTQYILSQVAGYGTPDYSSELQEILVKNVKSIKDDEI